MLPSIRTAVQSLHTAQNDAMARLGLAAPGGRSARTQTAQRTVRIRIARHGSKATCATATGAWSRREACTLKSIRHPVAQTLSQYASSNSVHYMAKARTGSGLARRTHPPARDDRSGEPNRLSAHRFPGQVMRSRP